MKISIILIWMANAFALRVCHTSKLRTSSLSIKMSVLDVLETPLLKYSLYNEDDSIKNILFPYQLTVVIFIFSTFGIMRSKINNASNIKQEIIKLQSEVQEMKKTILTNNNMNTPISSIDINEKEAKIVNLINEFDSVKTFIKINNFQLNIPVAALGGDINQNALESRNESPVESKRTISALTQVLRLVIGLIVLYSLSFILFLLNSPDVIQGQF